MGENWIFNIVWEHPTSLLAAPSNTYIGQTAPLFRALLNTHTSNCAALVRAPTKQLRNTIGCPFQGPNQTSTQRYRLPLSGPPRYRVSLCWPVTDNTPTQQTV